MIHFHLTSKGEGRKAWRMLELGCYMRAEKDERKDANALLSWFKGETNKQTRAEGGRREW